MTAGQPQAPSDAAGPPPDLDDLMGYSLKRAYMILQTAFRAALGEGGMANRVFSALSLVCSHPHLTQSDLARKLGIERSGLVAIVDDLQAQGLIRRVPVPQDRVSPTPRSCTRIATGSCAAGAMNSTFAPFGNSSTSRQGALVRSSAPMSALVTHARCGFPTSTAIPIVIPCSTWRCWSPA